MSGPASEVRRLTGGTPWPHLICRLHLLSLMCPKYDGCRVSSSNAFLISQIVSNSVGRRQAHRAPSKRLVSAVRKLPAVRLPISPDQGLCFTGQALGSGHAAASAHLWLFTWCGGGPPPPPSPAWHTPCLCSHGLPGPVLRPHSRRNDVTLRDACSHGSHLMLPGILFPRLN